MACLLLSVQMKRAWEDREDNGPPSKRSGVGTWGNCPPTLVNSAPHQNVTNKFSPGFPEHYGFQSKKRARDCSANACDQLANLEELPRAKRQAASTYSAKVREGDGHLNTFLRSVHVENAIHRGRCASIPLGSPVFSSSGISGSIYGHDISKEEPYNTVVDSFWENYESGGVGVG